jgi:NTP pyrophosphatase (non-canonical NTP hydrolase)
VNPPPGDAEAGTTPAPATLEELAARLREFARERDWEQFHTPKNLAMALAGEVGEVIEHFQWLSGQQSRELSPAAREAVALELADVLLYLVRLADQLGIDLSAAALRKIELNAAKYPAAAFRGSARKYDAPG